MTQRRVPLFDTTEDQTLRIQKELAVKIGFNEAVILMQLEYLISISDKQIEGNLWTYQSLEELKENSFPWWSIATISRTLKSLKDQGVIFIGNFNKRREDRTQWFALNLERIKELGVISLNDKHPILQNEKCLDGDPIMKDEEIPEKEIEPIAEPETAAESLTILQNETTILQFERAILQNETTLPETPTEITPKNLSPNGDSGLQPPIEEPISEKWNNANKKIVGDRFLELTHLKPPINKKTAGAWWGWLFEIFEIASKDSAEACRIMEIVVKYMQAERLTFTSPKSLIALANTVASGQSLNGKDSKSYGRKATQSNHRTGPPGTPVSATGLGEWTEDEKREYGFS